MKIARGYNNQAIKDARITAISWCKGDELFEGRAIWLGYRPGASEPRHRISERCESYAVEGLRWNLETWDDGSALWVDMGTWAQLDDAIAAAK